MESELARGLSATFAASSAVGNLRWISLYGAFITSIVSQGCSGSQESAPVEKSRTGWETVETTVTDASGEQTFLTANEMRAALGASEEATFERSGSRFISAMLANTGVKNLEPLAGQPLRRLDLSDNPIADITPLKGMPLEQLSLYGTKVVDLAPLQGMDLQVIDLTNTDVEDLSPLAGASHLKAIFLEGANVADLTPLQNLPIETLYLNQCPVKDLTPLKGKPLRDLNLCDTAITELTALEGMSLQTLWIRGTQVADLSPLMRSGLASLDIQGSQVADLTPLAALTSLQRLNIAGTNVTDLTPLGRLTLQRLILTPQKITRGIDIIRNMPSLRELDTSFEGLETPLSPAEFWAKFDRGDYLEKPAPAP